MYKYKHYLNLGSALNHIKRKREHFYNLKNNKHPNKKLQNAFNKYGYDCFEFKIIEIVDDENILLDREQWYINQLNPIYNICKVAGSSFGLKRSQETKNKIRIANDKSNDNTGITIRFDVTDNNKKLKK